MSFGVKRKRSIGGKRHSLGLRHQNDTESLFEKEWDELVIRFDEERQDYTVDTASQVIEPNGEGHTAELKP